MPKKEEIIYSAVGSILSGGLVLLGAFTDGHITREAIFAAVIAALSIALGHFKNFWDRKA